MTPVESDAPFEEPWQARLFALTQGVLDAAEVDREEFRRRLIAAVADEPARAYWESWLAAFESLLVELDVVAAEELDHITHG